MTEETPQHALLSDPPQKRRTVAFAVLLCLLTGASTRADTIVDPAQDEIALGDTLEMLKDISGTYTFDEVKSDRNSLSLKQRKLVEFEGLIRWRHPEHGLVPPDEFIPFAEDTASAFSRTGIVGIIKSTCRALV